MDLIDKKILCELDVNCRTPLSQLAKKLRINRNVVAYRINALETKQVITHYICSLNLNNLGYTTYKIYFKIHTNASEHEPAFIQLLLTHQHVLTLIKTEGSFDYSISFASKNIKELDTFLTHLKTTFKTLLKDTAVTLIVYSKIFKLHKLLLKETTNLKIEKHAGEPLPIQLDDKEISILRTLAQQANISLVELAQKTKLSLDIVTYRIHTLTKNVITSYRAIVDLNKLGYYHYALLVRTCATEHEENSLVEWCSITHNVLYCTKRIGEYTFEIHAALTDINDLNAFLSAFKQRFGTIIDSYEIIINAQLLKINYVPF